MFFFFFFQGVTLDARGHFTGEAEKKLEEVISFCMHSFKINKRVKVTIILLMRFSFFIFSYQLRKRMQGVSTSNHFEDLNSSAKISSDYYTQEEMVKFKKPN